jgi:class 3 adenylate cyclase/tetratricopeptide (TPR) repeat protein
MEHEKQALLQAISAYVPTFITGQILANPSISLAGWEKRMNAALLFADVSGFTAMSEGLAQMGKEGAETLTNILNAYFTTMIDLVHSYGGQVIKFGGDAITCAFVSQSISEPANLSPCEALNNLSGDVLHACACALAMQEKMVEFQAVETEGGTFELRMKIGISAGSVLFLSMGDPHIGLEYVLAGHPLDRMAEAEHHAAAGEVVIDEECMSGLEERWEKLGIIVGESREDFRLVRGLTLAVEKVPDQDVDWNALSEDMAEQVCAQLVLYLPPTVYERIVEGQRQFVAEQRRVVSLFVNFFGMDYEADPEAGQKLQQYFTAMQGIIHRYGGRLNRVITGDKGSMLHLIFGAPVAHEDNEALAVGCALEMQQSAVGLRSKTDNQPFIMDQQIGIASGYVFAGNVGSDRRREYTVMGDVVNLSARLMQAAGMWEILMDQRTARRAQGEFAYEELTPIYVKGKQEPVSVCRPIGARTEKKVWGPIVGRRQELALVEEIIEKVMAGHGQLLVISGEAGVGKSRLLEELIALGQDRGMYSMRGDCLSYGSQSPYLPWIDFFTSFFDVKTGGTERYEDRVRKIEQRMVEADPALKNWVPLMGQLLGLPVPDNELTLSLNAQLRKQRTFDITLTLLRHQAQQVPLFLIVIEDVHWIDSISLEMLNHIARNIADYRILLVAPHRPTIELSEWKRYNYYHQIELADLPAEDALKLVEFKLGMPQVPAPLRDLVLRGEERINPFFVEEVINSLVDRGYLVPRAEGEDGHDGRYELVGDLSQVEIPDSIQALVMSRIDRLDESSKLTVKVASVIGRTFKYHPLLGIYPVEIVPERLRDNLERLSLLNLTPLDRPEPELEYIFKHVTTQEVAYESLLYAHRRNLHHRLGEYLEQMYPDSLEEYYELLAHHYYQSGDQEKSWYYLVKAGDKAKDRYANEAAMIYYNQALSIQFDLEQARENVYRVYESRGDIYRLIGQYEKALESYQEALGYQPPTADQVANIHLRIARTWEEQGQYDKAMQHLDLARSTLSEAPVTSEMARIYSTMGWVAMRQGSYEQSLQLCAQAMSIINTLSDDDTGHRIEARLHHTLGSIDWRRGDYGQAVAHFQMCIEMWESIGDLYEIGRSYNNLAAVYWSQSNYDLAAQYIHESLKISQKIGFTYATAMYYNNLGVVYYALGDYPRAIEHYERSLEIRKEIGDLLGIADVYNNLGEVHHSLGDHQQSIHYLQDAVELFTEIGDQTALIEPYKLLAGVELELHNLSEALEYCQLLLEIAREIGNREYEGVAYRLLGRIYRADDKLEEAKRHLQNSVETLATVGNRLELGKSHYELGITLSAMGLGDGQEQLHKAIQIFEELGVEGELKKAQEALAN